MTKSTSSYIIKGEKHDWEVVCGLEVHCQIKSESKLFSNAPANFGSAPNSNVEFLDAGMPGMLPVINEECVRQAVRTALSLNAQVNNVSEFSRKNYFYADLSLGYQISQADKPIMGPGVVVLDMPDGTTRNIGLERMHMEIDAGKSMHDQHPDSSFIDFNRAGVGLMEIVSDPDIRTPEEAGAFLRKLRAIVRYVGSCDGNMDEGSMRCDANVSVRPVGSTELRTRCEIKNVNSVRYVMQAIEIEALRHVELYEAGRGDEIIQSSRLFDPNKGETRSMRSKENAHDYRYFPEPDLLPLVVSDELIAELKAKLPELPDAKKERFIQEFKLSPYDSAVLIDDRNTAEYYEIVAKIADPKLSANWITTNLFALLKEENKTIANSPISASNLGKLIKLITDDVISGKIAKQVFEIMATDDKDPEKIVEEKGLKQITDTSAIEKIIDELIESSPENVQAFKEGKTKVVGWFVGQVMKQTQGKANPGVVNKILKDKLS